MKTNKKLKVKKLKTFLVLIITLAIFVTIIASIGFKPIDKTETSESKLAITIESPLNQTYSTGNVMLKVVASDDAKRMAQSIDGGKTITECYSCNSYALYYLNFDKGTHTIEFYASDYDDKIIQDNVVFTIV